MNQLQKNIKGLTYGYVSVKYNRTTETIFLQFHVFLACSNNQLLMKLNLRKDVTTSLRLVEVELWLQLHLLYLECSGQNLRPEKI